MLVSNIDQPPVQIVSPKEEVEHIIKTERDIHVTLPNILVDHQ